MIILVDTREKKPLIPKGCIIKRRTLKSGDYSISGHTKKIIIERKALGDLYGTIAIRKNLIRFKKELERLKEVPYWFLLIEASPNTITKGYKYSCANGFAILCLIFELVIKYNGKVLFAQNKEEAKLLMMSAFTGYLNQKN